MANTNSANFGSANTDKSLSLASNLGITHQNVTFQFWIKLLAEIDSGTWTPFSLRTQTSSNFIDWTVDYDYNSGTRRLRFTRSKPGVGDNNITYNIALGTSSWHQISVKFDTTTLKLWVDGVERASGAASGVGTGGADNFSIGRNVGGTNQYTSALIDDVRVWNTPRSDGDLATDYTSPAELVGNETNLRAYYKFNVDLTSDETANNYDLTNNNTVTQSTDVPFTGTIAIDVSDQVNITESVALTLISNVNVSDQVNITEAVTLSVFFDAFMISVSDQVNITESVTVSNPNLGGISVSDQVNISESVTVTPSARMRGLAKMRSRASQYPLGMDDQSIL